MATEVSRAPRLRERPSFAQRLLAFWHEMAPQIERGYDSNGMERWDGLGEGPCRHFGFEGFGLSISIFYGRMPAKADAA